jgi:hypothetical protein
MKNQFQNKIKIFGLFLKLASRYYFETLQPWWQRKVVSGRQYSFP